MLDAHDENPWSVAGWQRRRGVMAQVLGGLDADLIAFRELENFRHGDDGSVSLARDDLMAAPPDFGLTASDDWRRFPSRQPILYHSDRLRLLDQGWFFFSDTPGVIYSGSFNGSYPAFASWAWLQDRRSGIRLRVVNVPLDFRSAGNRLQSARLIVERIAPWLARGSTWCWRAI